jgi:hypothetical protein
MFMATTEPVADGKCTPSMLMSSRCATIDMAIVSFIAPFLALRNGRVAARIKTIVALFGTAGLRCNARHPRLAERGRMPGMSEPT